METRTLNSQAENSSNKNFDSQKTKKSITTDCDVITISIKPKQHISVPKEIFCALFEASHLRHKKEYLNAVDDRKICFSTFRGLAREAEIPYSLFFAPTETVRKEIKDRNEILFQGVQNSPISVSSRGAVDVQDVSLIIKDIQKRQQLMCREYPDTKKNVLISKRSCGNVKQDASAILTALNLDMNVFRNKKKKEDSFNYLVDTLENNNFLISRSAPGVMPQTIFKDLSFSGFAVKNNKYPSIFLYSKEENSIEEPAGRRNFTLFLILASIFNNRFAIVSLGDNSDTEAKTSSILEYQIAEEILTPKDLINHINPSISSLEDIDEISEYFKVTPSMATVRLTKLGFINRDQSLQYMNELDRRRIQYLQHKHGYGNPSPATRILKYNGKAFTKTVLNMVRKGEYTQGEASRILAAGKNYKSALKDLGEKL